MNDSYELVLEINKEQAAILNNGWDGNGVPPVGTYCGYASKDAAGIEAKRTILAVYPEIDRVIVSFGLPGAQTRLYPLNTKFCNFYKIRSSEEYRSDAAKEAVARIMEVIKAAGAATLFDQLAALYEAGYAQEKN